MRLGASVWLCSFTCFTERSRDFGESSFFRERLWRGCFVDQPDGLGDPAGRTDAPLRQRWVARWRDFEDDSRFGWLETGLAGRGKIECWGAFFSSSHHLLCSVGLIAGVGLAFQ